MAPIFNEKHQADSSLLRKAMNFHTLNHNIPNTNIDDILIITLSFKH
jgi:hypothetical protein